MIDVADMDLFGAEVAHRSDGPHRRRVPGAGPTPIFIVTRKIEAAA